MVDSKLELKLRARFYAWTHFEDFDDECCVILQFPFLEIVFVFRGDGFSWWKKGFLRFRKKVKFYLSRHFIAPSGGDDGVS